MEQAPPAALEYLITWKALGSDEAVKSLKEPVLYLFAYRGFMNAPFYLGMSHEQLIDFKFPKIGTGEKSHGAFMSEYLQRKNENLAPLDRADYSVLIGRHTHLPGAKTH